MAIAVIGGLVTSTFLSLLVIPVAYTYLDDFNNWTRRFGGAMPPSKRPKRVRDFQVDAAMRNPEMIRSFSKGNHR